jgi:hypothetical protein
MAFAMSTVSIATLAGAELAHRRKIRSQRSDLSAAPVSPQQQMTTDVT